MSREISQYQRTVSTYQPLIHPVLSEIRIMDKAINRHVQHVTLVYKCNICNFTNVLKIARHYSGRRGAPHN